MRILLIHPNYHSGGTEIAGNWPPAWVAYLAGALKAAGYTEPRFLDTMTDNLSEEEVERLIAEERPDIVGATTITPSIYNTRVTDILRDEEHLRLFRRARLIHVSLGTEAAAQLKLDRFRKETTVAQNKKAIVLLRKHGIVAGAQFIVGLKNETRETLEETYRIAPDWKPDMPNWAMYTPWPFSDLFQDLGNKVQVSDFEKYNFVTPIIKPDAMERRELLDRVMHNYRRFYMRKTFFEYPWIRDREKRRYMLGCLKAFAVSGFQRKFYDLGRVNYWSPQSVKKVDFGFDASKAAAPHQGGDWKYVHRIKNVPVANPRELMAYGGGTDEQYVEGETGKRDVIHQMAVRNIRPNFWRVTGPLWRDRLVRDEFERAYRNVFTAMSRKRVPIIRPPNRT